MPYRRGRRKKNFIHALHYRWRGRGHPERDSRRDHYGGGDDDDDDYHRRRANSFDERRRDDEDRPYGTGMTLNPSIYPHHSLMKQPKLVQRPIEIAAAP